MVSSNVLLIGIDDTDDPDFHIGTGRLVRNLALHLLKTRPGISGYAVIRHQLLIHPDIPYTSHNSPACLKLEFHDRRSEDLKLWQTEISAYLHQTASPLAHPGLCLMWNSECPESLYEYGVSAAHRVLTIESARAAIRSHGTILLKKLWGTGQGIIGALSACVLTAQGYCGRFLEYNGVLRNITSDVTAGDLLGKGVVVASINAKAAPVQAEDVIRLDDWPRPRLIGGRPVLFVQKSEGFLLPFDKKGKKERVEPRHD